MGSYGFLRDIAGGEYSDWITGTSKYTVCTGFEAFAFVPDASGATIDTGEWLAGTDLATVTTITDVVKSQWIDASVTVGPIVFFRPVVSVTLSAGSGMIYCRRSMKR